MNSENTVLFSVEAGLARITLNRPVSRNAMDLELARRLHRVLEDAAGDDQVQVLLLAGNGRLFCSGGDLRSIAATQDRGALLRELVSSAHGAVRVLAGLDKPVVAAVQGSAAGAGLSLALVSDVVLAAPRTSFITAYTAVGLTPDCGQSWLLPRVVGLGRALDLTLNPVKVSSEAARAMGIVSRIVPGESLQQQALHLATQLASGPAQALGQARTLLRSGYGAGFDAHLNREAETIAQMAATTATGALIGSFVAAAP